MSVKSKLDDGPQVIAERRTEVVFHDGARLLAVAVEVVNRAGSIHASWWAACPGAPCQSRVRLRRASELTLENSP